MIIHGRSDATLNPGGVRIGTAEIYNQVEQMPEIARGALHRPGFRQRRARRAVRAAGRRASTLDDDLEKRIRAKIRTGASPRHVPAKIVAVADIPRTKSGKITELAVRDVVHGRAVKNKEALANPEALELFREPAAAGGLTRPPAWLTKICRSNLPRFHEWYTFVNFSADPVRSC